MRRTKKLLGFTLSIAMALNFASCGVSESPASETELETTVMESASETELETTVTESASETEPENGNAQGEDTEDSAGGSNILIAYFSVPEDIDTSGIDADAGASVVVTDEEVLGNTQYMASIIQETVGGDLFRIETVEAYPLDHDPLVDQAAEEQDADARPALSTHIENPDQYDTIILGYPNWWGDMPQPLYTFLEEYDFSGKTIIPFCPHGGSGFSDTVETIGELQPQAKVSDDGLSISRNDVANARDEIGSWVQGLGL